MLNTPRFEKILKKQMCDRFRRMLIVIFKLFSVKNSDQTNLSLKVVSNSISLTLFENFLHYNP